MLDDFEQARAIFALRQRTQQRGIYQHRQRLVKAADQILAGRQIHSGFSANGRIHLPQQRRGNLDQGNAAHEDCSQKARDIGDDSAAHRDHQASAVRALLNHLFGQRFHFRQSLARFAARKQEHLVR